MQEPLLLVGASVRAAVFSARRAGLHLLHAVDLFADADLAAVCPVHKVPASDYPGGLVAVCRKFPPGPILYTGALENSPRVIAALAEERRLWGNGPETLSRVRDPFVLEVALQEAGLAHPRARHTAPEVKEQEQWLIKRRRSAGGAGIRPWQGQALKPGEYLQEFIPGAALAALFCGLTDERFLLLGVTRQLVGEAWAGAAPFHYCGSVGPIQLAEKTRQGLHSLGALVVKRFGLRGLFGVDFILHEDAPYPVEVNPRYTASVEVLERATGVQSLAWHRAAFGATLDVALPPPRSGFCGKAILFAHAPLTFPAAGPWQKCIGLQDDSSADFADIPHAAASIQRGQPILTVFAQAQTPDKCVDALREKVTQTKRWLYP